MIKVTIKSNLKREVLDITDKVNEEIKRLEIKDGVCNLFLTHTTAALTCADLDPGTDQDYLDAYDELVPKIDYKQSLKFSLRSNYKHPHDPSHMPDHILSSLIGTSLTIPVENGKLVLGTWQKVILIEFDGPRERELVIQLS